MLGRPTAEGCSRDRAGGSERPSSPAPRLWNAKTSGNRGSEPDARWLICRRWRFSDSSLGWAGWWWPGGEPRRRCARPGPSALLDRGSVRGRAWLSSFPLRSVLRAAPPASVGTLARCGSQRDGSSWQISEYSRSLTHASPPHLPYSPPPNLTLLGILELPRAAAGFLDVTRQQLSTASVGARRARISMSTRAGVTRGHSATAGRRPSPAPVASAFAPGLRGAADGLLPLDTELLSKAIDRRRGKRLPNCLRNAAPCQVLARFP